MLTLDEILERVAARYDEVTIMEALEITAEELVERFSDKVNTNSWKFEWDALPAGQKKWVKVDVIDKPEHYNKGGIEAIDYIKQQLGKDFSAYCEGNVHKYIHRYKYKNGVEDLRKARVYLEWLIQSVIE